MDNIIEGLFGLAWSLFLIALAIILGWYALLFVLMLTAWGLGIGVVTWLVFDSFWVGFAIGIVITIWKIWTKGFGAYLESFGATPPSSVGGGYTSGNTPDYTYDPPTGGGRSDNYESLSCPPPSRPRTNTVNRVNRQMRDMGVELREMEQAMSAADRNNREARDAYQKFMQYKDEAAEALSNAEIAQKNAEDSRRMAEDFNDSSYWNQAREYSSSYDYYRMEAQQKKEQADYYYNEYMRLKAEAEYQKTEAHRLKDYIKTRSYYAK